MDVSDLYDAVAITVAASTSYLLARVLYQKFIVPNDFRCKIQCNCGSVLADIHVPFTSRIVRQTNCLCCCDDCIGFAKYIAQKSNPRGQNMLESTDFEAVQMVQFYKSDVTLLEGLQNIKAVQMYKGAPCYRYYAKCCNTPLCLVPTASWAPIIVIYRKLLEKPGIVYDKPDYVLFTSFLPIGGEKHIPSHASVSENLSKSFFVRVLARIFCGVLSFKNSPSPLDGVDHDKLEYVEKEE
mmetsp:Transcript_12607/g.15649  ORF Transcript_12607/g.15649 Transcript_12607/m.15649 type:complete len:239 (+) Transcript_12607:237-953(+)